MTDVLAALAGFSTGMALLLALGWMTLWRDPAMLATTRLGGCVMLCGLSLSCWHHLWMVDAEPAQLPSRVYGVVLFLQSLGFYHLLRGVLRPASATAWLDAAAWLSALSAGLWLPRPWLVPSALLMGTCLALHLAWLLWRLRGVRRWFRVELPVVGLFAGMGVTVAVAGLITPQYLEWAHFGLLYSIQIAIGFALMAALLVAVPELADKTREAVAASYAQSTLGRVDVTATAERVRALIEDKAVYSDESLSLSTLAGMVGISTHQLSELVNQHFGVGFSRLVRAQRVAAAQRMLIDEPRASVLSVGMAVGFGSQSTFYAAFKEVLGVVPGEYRRRQLLAEADGVDSD